ncbi:MAG TPA: AtpZ/AtpI family protein [Pyrinomonadaceae bacterium]|nr:AtpZ/AtpI family protein [Pyrinomonadaceae bacterium]
MAKQDDQNINRKSGALIGAVMALSSSIVSCLIVGWLLDRWLGTSPWLIVVGIIVGSVAGFMHLIRVMSRIS